MNPFNPFGVPGDPMEQVLSLQSFSLGEDDGEAASNQCSGSNQCKGSNICTDSNTCTDSNSCKNSNECANSNQCGDDEATFQ